MLCYNENIMDRRMLLELLNKENIRQILHYIRLLTAAQIIAIGIFLFFGVMSYTIYNDPGIIYSIIEKRALSDAFERTLMVAPDLQQEMERLRSEVEATAVSYFRYHNGTSSAGFPFVYNSSILSVSAPRWVDSTDEWQRLSASADLDQLTSHIKGACQFRFIHTDPNIAFKRLYLASGIKEVASCPIFNDGLLVGYIAVVWNYSYIDQELSTKMIEINTVLTKVKFSAENIERIHYGR